MGVRDMGDWDMGDQDMGARDMGDRDILTLVLWYFGNLSVAPLRQSYSIGTPLYKQNKIRFGCFAWPNPG